MNMKRKALLVVVLLIAVAFRAAAQDYNMIVERVSGETVTFKVENVEDVRFVERPDDNDGWMSLGMCKYGEDFIGSFLHKQTLGDYVCDYYVEVQQNEDNSGLYRLVNPYGPDVYPYASNTSYDSEQNYYIEIDCTDPEGVFIPLQDTGMTWGSYGRIWVYSYAMYYMDLGYTLSEVKELGLCGALSKGKITFPYDTLLLYAPSYNSTNYYLANMYDGFVVDTTDRQTAPARPAATLSHPAALVPLLLP